MILTPEFRTALAEYNAGVRRAVEANREPVAIRGRVPDPCGTPGAYRRHRVAGEEPCGPCIVAASVAWKVANDKRQRAKKRRGAA